MICVPRIEVEYSAPARLDDALIVETRLRAMGAATLDLTQTVLREEEGKVALLATLVVGLVCVRAGGLRPVRIPAPWRDALAGNAGTD